jgi:hypothetical protein
MGRGKANGRVRKGERKLLQQMFSKSCGQYSPNLTWIEGTKEIVDYQLTKYVHEYQERPMVIA